MKRLILLLAALMLGAFMAAAEGIPLPMNAAECPIRLEDVAPMTAAAAPAPGVRLTPWDAPAAINMARYGNTVRFMLDGPSPFDELTGELQLYAGKDVLRLPAARLSQTADGRIMLFFDLADELTIDSLSSFILQASYAGDGYDETVTLGYQCYEYFTEPTLRTASLRLSTAEGDSLYRYNAEGRLTSYAVEGPGGYEISYQDDGSLSHATVRTENPARTYSFHGTGLLSSLEDEASGVIISYDWDSGVMDGYRVTFTVPDAQGAGFVSYSPYGAIDCALYYLAAPEGAIKGYEWSPENGWKPFTKSGEACPFPDAGAPDLPDVAAMTPPLPAAELPEFRLDVSSVADLPALPIEGDELPRVLDFRVEGGLATVLLDRPLTPEGGCLRVCDYAWHWGGVYTDVIAVATTDDGLAYTAAVPEDTELYAVCLDYYLPAADASRFSCRYLYDPDDALWEVHLDSPAATFSYYFTSDGSVSRASFGSYLTSLYDHSYLTFDEATGKLTEYLWYVESPLDDTGWYQLLYIPGEGVVNARVGEGEGLFYEWKPETGWLDSYDGGPADEELLDPLNFPHPYPFPQEP